MHRNVVHSKQFKPGSVPEGDDCNDMIEVEIRVTYPPHAENELIAHYLLNQVHRKVLADLDRRGLDRVIALESV